MWAPYKYWIARNSTLNNKIQFEPLNEEEIASILRNTQNYPLGMTDNADEFRISIAGAQEKAAFLYWKGKWNRPLGTTPTTHIFKLPIGFIPHQQMDLSDSCENEWLCSQIAEHLVYLLRIVKFNILKMLNSW